MLHRVWHRLACHGHRQHTATPPGASQPHYRRRHLPKGEAGRVHPGGTRCRWHRVLAQCGVLIRQLPARQGSQKRTPEKTGGHIPRTDCRREGNTSD